MLSLITRRARRPAAEIEQAWNMRIWTSPPLAERWGNALERAKDEAGFNG